MAQAGKKRTQMPGAGRRRMANNHTPGKLSPQGWQAVAKTLPASFDQARMRAGLDRIAQELMARAKRSSKKLMEECQKRAWACDYLIRKLPENQAGFIKREELMRQSEFEKERAKLYERMINENKSQHFLWHCEILWLWQEQAGRDPSIYSAGSAARYLRAATSAVFGEELGAEGAKDVIERFRHRMNFSTARIGATSEEIRQRPSRVAVAAVVVLANKRT